MNDDETTTPDTSEKEVIYVKERPFIRLLTGGVISLIGIVIILYIIGLIMGLMGINPPTFDRQIINDQLDKTLGNKVTSYSECVEKGGLVQEKWPPACVYSGDTFNQSLTEACETVSEEAKKDPEHDCFIEKPE